MLRRIAIIVCIAIAAVVTTGAAAHSSSTFRPRIGGALGLAPVAGEASGPGALVPVTYHGGGVMNHGVTVHLIFWAPAGYAFSGSPGGGALGYKALLEQYFTDVAADSGPVSPSDCATANGECNIFSTLTQFGSQDGSGAVTPGNYSISFSSGADVINDTDPYPTQQCTSPQDTKACVLDSQMQSEIDHVVSTHGNGRGLTNLWYVFTPPDVDECISAGVCETNDYGGYHSVSDVGQGPTIYAYTGDPIVESQTVLEPGNDPQGNPDAEVAVDVAAHETNEAMTDPEGVGWMDPNGYEVADKCEDGSQLGTPLGYAPDGSPYNQVINGHEYLTQESWSNDGGQGNPAQNCVQGTTATDTGLPLPQVNLTQFSGTVTGNIGTATPGVGVTVTLRRGPAATRVAQASTTTSGAGAWSVTLKHPVGDDRDEIDVRYSGGAAPTPNRQVILTGNGDDPVDEAGWTGWTWLDQGFALTNHDASIGGGPSLSIGPCFQTGVEAYTVAGVAGAESPTDFCGTASGVADTPLAAKVTRGQVVTYSTNDNRAFQPPDVAVPNGAGGLVDMTVNVGEPDSIGAFDNGLFASTGFPTCTDNLGVERVTCSGLVPFARYTLDIDGYEFNVKADGTGVARDFLPAGGGAEIALVNSAGRTLTTLHVASLQVHIVGNSRTVKSGTCSPLEYWGGPLTIPPTSAAAGEPTSVAGGSALTGRICPASGRAAGLPTSDIAQTDEFSGGETVTEIAKIASTSPLDGETVYGSFTALARASHGKPTISLSIARAGSSKRVAGAANVDTARGVTIPALAPGNYTATWTVRNLNGDTRVVTTRFIEGQR